MVQDVYAANLKSCCEVARVNQSSSITRMWTQSEVLNLSNGKPQEIILALGHKM